MHGRRRYALARTVEHDLNEEISFLLGFERAFSKDVELDDILVV